MCTERGYIRCNEHKLLPPDSQFPWCLSCCFWYSVVLPDVVRVLWAMSIARLWNKTRIPSLFIILMITTEDVACNRPASHLGNNTPSLLIL
jgi:hypothetical protein